MDMSYPDYGLNHLNYFQTLYIFGQQCLCEVLGTCQEVQYSRRSLMDKS